MDKNKIMDDKWYVYPKDKHVSMKDSKSIWFTYTTENRYYQYIIWASAHHEIGINHEFFIRLEWDKCSMLIEFVDIDPEINPYDLLIKYILMNPKAFIAILLLVESVTFKNPIAQLVYRTSIFSDEYPSSIDIWKRDIIDILGKEYNIKPSMVHILCDEDSLNEYDMKHRPDYQITFSANENVSFFHKKTISTN